MGVRQHRTPSASQATRLAFSKRTASVYLLRNGDDIFADFEDFKNKLAEVNFLRPADRANADLEQILTDAYNFLLLQDMEEDRLFEERDL